MILLLHLLQSLVFLLPSHALFTAVPPSSNPSSKVHKEFLTTLEDHFILKREPQVGRVWFDIQKDDETTAGSLSQVPINQINARSIRIIALQAINLIGKNEDEQKISSLLCENLKTDLATALDRWKDMGNTLPPKGSPPSTYSSISFSLSCQKWNDSVCTISRTKLCQIVTKRLHEEFGWTRVPKSSFPTLRFHLLVYESSAIMELVSLIRPAVTNELPKPGFKRVESFALCRSADIQSDDTVLDPMCGKATFLLEAATIWRHAATEFHGIDCSPTQLQDAQENVNASCLQNKIQLILGDARELPYEDSSIDKIISCPPFGRQFEKTVSFEELLVEWSRVLKENGRMVLLLDTSNVQPFIEATKKTNCCHVDYCRSPSFKLGKIRATILIVSKTVSSNTPKEGKLPWEQGHSQSGRQLWATLRSQALPSLVPYSRVKSQ